jgi:bifunctional enzyme CysN/CysC
VHTPVAIFSGKQESTKDLLRFITCGSVDDGKSTLIGRLLHDSKLILEDQLSNLAKASSVHGTTGDDIDFALLVDGLEAEREQGITIDVAYRFFSTARRSFIVADTPGHEQFTRNMATGASHADLAVILVDARKGVLVQTRRHALICSLLGIRHVVVAVNKIDLVDFSKQVFEQIVDDFSAFAARLSFSTIVAVPISARYGDNIVTKSDNTPWYRGSALIDLLETIDVDKDIAAKPFRFPVQWVNRPNLDFRGYAGTVASGSIKPGEEIIVAESGRSTKIQEILCYEGAKTSAQAGDAVTITLTDNLDITRGDLLVEATSRPEVSDQFAANIIWMSDQPLIPGRSYLARIGTKTTPISITAIKYSINVNTGEHLAAASLDLNDIAFCNVSTATPCAFDPYEQNRRTGSFIIIDRTTNHTVGAGMITFALRRGTNIHWQALSIGKSERASLNEQKPAILWFTGLSGAGKSTIANLVEKRLYAAGHRTMLLDGDNVRHGLNRDLGFTEADRVENVRRAGETAKLMTEAGLIVLCSFISPFKAERDLVRRMVGKDEFLEVFVDAPIEVCMRRDPKGLYAKAKAGTIKNFTGFDSPYDIPQNPEIHLDTVSATPEQLSEQVIQALTRRGFVRL